MHAASSASFSAAAGCPVCVGLGYPSPDAAAPHLCLRHLPVYQARQLAHEAHLRAVAAEAAAELPNVPTLQAQEAEAKARMQPLPQLQKQEPKEEKEEQDEEDSDEEEEEEEEDPEAMFREEADSILRSALADLDGAPPYIQSLSTKAQDAIPALRSEEQAYRAKAEEKNKQVKTVEAIQAALQPAGANQSPLVAIKDSINQLLQSGAALPIDELREEVSRLKLQAEQFLDNLDVTGAQLHEYGAQNGPPAAPMHQVITKKEMQDLKEHQPTIDVVRTRAHMTKSIDGASDKRCC